MFVDLVSDRNWRRRQT